MKLAAAAAVLLFVFALPVHAQVAGGTVSGKVTGESGAAIPNTHISIQHASTGLVRSAMANSDGIYSLPDLPDGIYELTAAAPGFVTEVWTGVVVTGGIERALNIVMHPGKPE